MASIVSIIVPIFGLICVGYLAARLHYLSASAADGVTAFVFGISTPTLLFRTLATAQFGEASPLFLWIAYFAGVVAVFACGMLIAGRFGADRRTSVIAGAAASYSNLVMVGIPTTERMFGREGLDLLALLLAVHLPVMVAASTLLVERAAMLDARDGLTEGAAFSYRAALRRIWRSLSRNALIIGIVCGLVWRLTGLPLSGPPADIVDAVASTAGPMALIALGLSLPRYKIGHELALPALLATLALLLQPAVVLLVGLSLLPPEWLGVMVLVAAAPSGVNAYLLAAYFKSGESMAASVTVLSTIASIVTLAFWVAILGS